MSEQFVDSNCYFCDGLHKEIDAALQAVLMVFSAIRS